MSVIFAGSVQHREVEQLLTPLQGLSRGGPGHGLWQGPPSLGGIQVAWLVMSLPAHNAAGGGVKNCLRLL